MLKRIMLMAVALSWLPINASAINIIEINTELMWDVYEPHEGRIVNEKVPAPTEYEYQAELGYYASLIEQNDADIVGLVELEGCHVAEDIARAIDGDWIVVCQKGRDTFTGQDVALLFDGSAFKVNMASKTTFPDHYGMNGEKRVRPSKIISVVAEEKATGESYLVTGLHLISKTRPTNELKRHAQARAVRSGVDAMKGRYNIAHEVVLGDINDYPGSVTMEILKNGQLVNPADSDDCSYIYKGKCNLIDHIIVSEGLGGGELSDIEMPAVYSDHKAVVYKEL